MHHGTHVPYSQHEYTHITHTESFNSDTTEGEETKMGKTSLAAPLIFGTATESIIQTGTLLRV